jgi:hypothetical protein
VKLVRVIAFAVFFVAAPVASPAQSLDMPLLSAQCTDDYYEDADGQCDGLSAGEVLTIEAILAKYGTIITGRTDDEVIAFYLDDLDDLDDMPVGSIRPRNEDAVPTDDNANADPANEPDTIASRIIKVDQADEMDGEGADDITTTGPTAQSLPPATEPVDDNRTIE